MEWMDLEKRLSSLWLWLWLVKPFVNTRLFLLNHYIYIVSRARVIVEHRIWSPERCLQKELIVQVEDIPNVVGACSVLHSTCIQCLQWLHWWQLTQYLHVSQESLPTLSAPTGTCTMVWSATNDRRIIMLQFSVDVHIPCTVHDSLIKQGNSGWLFNI